MARFNEKTTEMNLPVVNTAKYNESKAKAIEMIDSKKYGLTDGDFWILMNQTKAKDKMLYTGLIISHNGCLKVNDTLETKFKPECVTVNENGYKNSLVFTYCCPEQGVYEVGEVSASNCKNEYPYAMAFKRLFDRVVLKLSKLAYSGICSEVEVDEFEEQKPDTPTERKATEEQIQLAVTCGVDFERVIGAYNRQNGTKITAPLDLPYDIVNRAILKKQSAKVATEAQEVFK